MPLQTIEKGKDAKVSDIIVKIENKLETYISDSKLMTSDSSMNYVLYKYNYTSSEKISAYVIVRNRDNVTFKKN